MPSEQPAAPSEQPAQTPPATPKNPDGLPRPGSLPKLPQTIFNLEKRGGDMNRPRPRT